MTLPIDRRARKVIAAAITVVVVVNKQHVNDFTNSVKT